VSIENVLLTVHEIVSFLAHLCGVDSSKVVGLLNSTEHKSIRLLWYSRLAMIADCIALHCKVLMDAYNILDSLLISSFILAKNRAFLARHDVTHIINATSTLANSHQHDRILYLRVPLEDKIGFEFPLSYFDDACSFIGVNNCCRRQSYILENGLSKSGVILVHCARGYSCWQFHL